MSKISKDPRSEPGVIVADENRRNSYSSEELSIELDNSVMDSIKFDRPEPRTAKTSEASTSAVTGKISTPPPETVQKLILASKAYRKTGTWDCVYTLRRLARYFAEREGLCETKGVFAKIYKEIKLPGDLADPEPEYESDLPEQEWCEYAHSRAKEVVQALEAAGLEKDDQVKELSKCVSGMEKIVQEFGLKR